MKKFIALALLLFVIATGAFAMDRNFGFGVGYNMGTADNDYYNDDFYYAGIYLFGFFGINRFIELNLGLIEKWYYQYDYFDYSMTGMTALQLGIYGKYPFSLGSNFVLFPTAGVDFEFDVFDGDLWHEFCIRGGLGMDLFLSERFFLRGHLLYGFGFPISDSSWYQIGSSSGFQAKLGLGRMF